ncbi:MAG: hypothetical protein Tsb002_22390 [Wenzhouxiangellaceae bacterium]
MPYSARRLIFALFLLPGATLAAAIIDPALQAQFHDQGPYEALIELRDQASLLASAENRVDRLRQSAAQLRSLAQNTQAPLLDWLRTQNIEHRSYWIVNSVWVKATAKQLQELAKRDDIAAIHNNPQIRNQLPQPAADNRDSRGSIEPSISLINAPDVWNMGIDGAGVVIGGQDTGYQWDHPGLIEHYRGWNGASADHNYHWHDSIHSGGGSCGPDNLAPCDDHGHGTHTMGTMVGDDGGANQVGVAPGARWIGCRNMDVGNGTPATYLECLQWFLSPTDLNNENPDPAMAPHVINNSWGCPTSEGCTDPNILLDAVDNLRAAGIVVVVSAGNSGPGCSSVTTPAAIYTSSFSVAASSISDQIAGFSSRGPVTVDGSGRLKPDITAPGVSIRSTTRGGGYGTSSGTSMAGPHVAGLVALIIAANPSLAGQVDTIEAIIRDSAVPMDTTQDCGGTAGSVPNNVFGWGRIDALAAVNMAMTDTIHHDGFEVAAP